MQSAIKLMAEQATEQIAVEWEGIGHFVATKHPEYVAEDPDSGLQTMYPPRISYRLSQQDPAANVHELNATQFSFHLARYAKATEGDAEFFMHTVTKLILERLDANDPVEIQGLGVFSWVESQQGRRMSLQVDEKMRNLVNAPFACFEPMVVAVEAPKPEAPVEPESPAEPTGPVVPVVPVVPTEPTEPENPESPDPIVAPEPESAPEPVPEPAPAPAPVPEPTPAPAPVKKRVREPEPSVLDKLKPQLDKVKSQLENFKPQLEQLKSLPKSYLYGGIAGAVVLLALLIWLLIPSSPKEPKQEVAATENIVASESPDSPDSPANPETAELPESPAKPAQSAAPTQPKAAQPAPTKPVAQSASKPSVPKGTKPSDDMLLLENGQPKMDQLGEGGRLTLVALRNYGDKAFWAYVYDVNAFQLGNPNNVPVGLPLYLPDPSYFKIDSSDPASVKRAQNRAMQILREWE